MMSRIVRCFRSGAYLSLLIFFPLAFLACGKGDEPETVDQGESAARLSSQEGPSSEKSMASIVAKLSRGSDEPKKIKDYVPRPLRLPDVVASVDGKNILRVELEDALIRRFQRESYARFSLLFGAMLDASLERRGIKISEAEVDADLVTILAGQSQSLEEFLEKKRYTEAFLRRQVITRVSMKKYAVAIGHRSEASVEENFNMLDPELLNELARENKLLTRPHGIPDDAYATVNGKPVAQEDVLSAACAYVTWPKLLKVLDELIAVHVDDAMIARYEIEVDQSLVEKSFGDNASKVGGPEMYAYALSLDGLSTSDKLEHLNRFFGVQEILNRDPAPGVFEAFYEMNRDEMKLGARVRMRDLFFPAVSYSEKGSRPTDGDPWEAARLAAEAAWKLIEEGAELDEEFVKAHVPKEGKRGVDGDIGWLSMDQSRMSVLRDRGLTMEVGEVSEPFTAKHGYHIVKLLKKAEPKTFEEAMADPRHATTLEKKYVILGKRALRAIERKKQDVKIYVRSPSDPE